MNTSVRCPSERCGVVFRPPAGWLGRNMYCPACGVRMTARPIAVDTELRARPSAFGGGRGGMRRLPFAVLVDNVRSLWNIGSIFRTADACGVEKLVLTGISGCPPRDAISKTALGAEQVIPWEYHADAPAALKRLIEQGYVPLALEATPLAEPLERVRWPERPCLVIGNEVAGVGAPLLDACSRHVAIPMRGVKDSLNVAVAFGIAAHRVSLELAAESAVVR